MPEEWIMSTIAAKGKDRPAIEGLSNVITQEGDLLLRTLITSEPEMFLGERVAKKFGSPGILIKILDTAERLTVQVHPDRDFARRMFNSVFGKTESWYILGERSIEGEESCIYLGFKEGITREKWTRLFLEQDIKGILDCLHRFNVTVGDAFIIPGGIPHAIGPGCFLMEVQEPTDLTLRVEKITPRGLKISDELIHQGIGMENMLQCFNYDGCSFDEAIKRWKVEPEIIGSSGQYVLKTIFNEKHTSCFDLKELELKSHVTLEGNGDFFVAVVFSGTGIIYCNDKEQQYEQGDSFFFPGSISKVELAAVKISKILLCYPPL